MRGGNGDAAGSPRVVFGRVVRHCREQAGLSQEQLGGLVYLTGDMVAKIERGKRTASEKFVIDCEALPELPTNGTLQVLWEQLREAFHRPPVSLPGSIGGRIWKAARGPCDGSSRWSSLACSNGGIRAGSAVHPGR